jgi:hypothetical protein
MAIIKSSESGKYRQHDYSGRVIEIRRYKAHRNMSDTLDYTDWRTVDCCDALVWLGTEGHPGNYEWNPSRPLEFHEQFMWVDCSNHFSDRCGYTAHPEVDVHPGSGEPIMWANLLAWRGHQEALRKEKIAQKEAADVERRERFNAQLAAEAARKQAMEERKAEAESLLRIWAPSKGSEVTLEGLTGTVFWTGVKHYRGAWRSTVGVKDKAGTAHWVDISKFMPPVEKKVRSRKEKNQK